MPFVTTTSASTMMPPIAILTRNIATEGIQTHHLHLATMTRCHTIDATERKEKDTNPIMALEIGSGDIDAITPMKTTSANFGMVSKLKTHAQSTEDPGTGAPRATAWEIMQPLNIVTTTNTLHQIGPRMTIALLAEDTHHTSLAAVHPMEAISPKNRDTCRRTAVERHSQKKITIIIKSTHQITVT